MKVIEKADTVEPLLCSVKAGATMIGRSPRFIADGIARGLFRAVKSDRRTLLVVQSLRDYVAGLPPAKGTKNRPRWILTRSATPLHRLASSANSSAKKRSRFKSPASTGL